MNAGLKTGILSMQRIRNYGSFLQAYALRKMLEEHGCAVEFVDYQPGECLEGGSASNGPLRKVRKGFAALSGKSPLADKLRYVRYKKDYATNYYPLLGLSETPNLNPSLELLVIGSDEVFNCVQDNPNVGFTPALFGCGIDAGHKVTYAASFGNTTIEKLVKHGKAGEVAGYLSALDMVSVRDSNSLTIVEELAPEVPCRIDLDPVLTYGFADELDSVQPNLPFDSDYLVLYGYNGRFTAEECMAVRGYADERGLKIVCVGGVQKCCDRFIDCEPLDVLGVFRGARCVVTDTFHGTILSIISHKNFVAFVRSEGYGNVEKLADLLSRLKLENRAVSVKGDVGIQMESTLDDYVDYETCRAIVDDHRLQSHNYINEIVLKAGNLAS